MYKSKHLPLLALALLVSSTELRAEDFPFKVGDTIIAVGIGGAEQEVKITNIKGRWIEGYCSLGRGAGQRVWLNSDNLISIIR
jgi:hypothetical protein